MSFQIFFLVGLFVTTSVIVGDPNQGGGVTRYVPLDIQAPITKGKNLNVLVPTTGKTELGSPAELFEAVKEVWDVVGKGTEEAGLIDAKMASQSIEPLGEDEAWHHFKAGKEGVIDSARFLITFSLIPSLQQGGDPLHIATIHGNLDRMRNLIQKNGVDVDLPKISDGVTPLIIASIIGNEEALDLLIDLDANVNKMSKNGITPLIAASTMGHYNIVEKLLKADANPDKAHPYAKTSSIHFASEMGHGHIITLLCEHGADPNSRKINGGSPVHTAADTNQTISVIALIKNCSSNPELLVAGDTTPLYLAAQRGFSDVVQALFEVGHVNPNFVMPVGNHKTDLIVHEEENAKFYPTKNTEIGNGATALHAAVENGHLLTVRALMKNGAKQLSSMEGATPLMIALQYKHPRIAMNLLSKGYEPHVNKPTPKDGLFPLFLASQNGFHKVVDRLLSRGADIFQKVKGRDHDTMSIAYRHKSVMQVIDCYMKRQLKCRESFCSKLEVCKNSELYMFN